MEHGFGRGPVGRLETAAAGGGSVAQGDKALLRAAFLGVRGATSVRQEMLERAEQEASEASARRVGLVKEIPLKTEGEEVLDKVLGLLLAAAGATEIAIDRLPVALNEEI